MKKNVQLAKANIQEHSSLQSRRSAFRFAQENKGIPSIAVHLALAQTASSHEVLDMSSGSSANFIDSLQSGFPRIRASKTRLLLS